MKTKIIFIIICSLFTVNIGFPQTNVSGPYFTNTTWGIAGSPYNVVGNVQVAPGVTLTIEPGVTINFNGNYQILLKGNIIANGTSSSYISFNGSSSGGPMLMFKSTNLSNSQLSYLEFTGPKDALQLANESEFNQDTIKNSGTLYVNNVDFTNTKVTTHGYQTTATLSINHAAITGTTVIGVYPQTEPIIIKNSNIDNSIITSDAYNYGVSIENCFISNTTLNIGCCGGNLDIKQSEFTSSNIADGGMGNPLTGPVIITDSRLTNTPIHLPNAHVEITNTIINNVSSTTGILMGTGIIDCVSQTGADTGIAITTVYGYGDPDSIRIYHSSITQNLVGVTILGNSNSLNWMLVDSSNFYNNTLYNIRNFSTHTVVCPHIWWGTTNVADIEAKIYDFYDDMNLGDVNYTNYLLAYKPFCDTLSVDNKDIVSQNMVNFKVYPNPASEWIFIENLNANNENKDVFVDIYNTIGQAMYNGQLNNQNKIEKLNISCFPKGIYIVRLKNEKGFQLKKLIIF